MSISQKPNELKTMDKKPGRWLYYDTKRRKSRKRRFNNWGKIAEGESNEYG